MEETEGPMAWFSLFVFMCAAVSTCVNLYICIGTMTMVTEIRELLTQEQVVGSAYADSCKAALQLATRNSSNNDSYQGHGYSDSKAASEDAHYHDNPSAYDGRQG